MVNNPNSNAKNFSASSGRNNQRPQKKSRRFGRQKAAYATQAHKNLKNAAPNSATLARKAALQITKTVREEDTFLSAVAPAVLDSLNLPIQEKAFAQLLARGVVTTQGTLDEMINAVLKNPHDIKSNVRDALRISVYEILFLDKGAHAAVDQGVELVRSVSPKATGVANFVLRRIVEKRTEFPFGPVDSDIAAAARYYGFPLWLAQAIETDCGAQNARVIMEKANEPAPIYFVINHLRVNPQKTLEVLSKAGIECVMAEALPGVNPLFPAFQLVKRNQIGHPVMVELLKADAVLVSDQAAQSIVSLALPESCPASFLEIGSGRGTKTLMLQMAAELKYGKSLEFDCLDANDKKLTVARKRAENAQIPVREYIECDATNLSSLPEAGYDAVFIDAPCTGVGTLSRHPEIRWRLKPQDSSDLAAIGLAILKQAARLLAPNGRLTYATCTLFAQENQKVIDAFMSSKEGAQFSAVPYSAVASNEEVAAHNGAFITPVTLEGCDVHFAQVFVKDRN